MTAVVVGSGLAGLVTALEVARRERCTLVTAGAISDDAASTWAQGGLAAALATDDSPALHAHDTWKAGAGCGDVPTIERITQAAPGVVKALADLGVKFDRTDRGAYDLGLEGGHSRNRIVHDGDRSGAAITHVVAKHVLDHPRITLREGLRATGLILIGPRVVGLRGTGAHGDTELAADSIVLATGGLGGLFPHTTNPLGAVGSGVALAARVGARTDDLHLVQFHPTALDIGLDPAPLLTEALRGAGAILLADGERFIDELQPRDVVSGAVWQQLQDHKQVILDASRVEDAARRFPAVTALLAPHGLSLQDPLPVRPAAHYSMGGVTVDAAARTSIPGLYAVGEVSRTGLHGANRLASNSLLEAVVTGAAAARSILASPASAQHADRVARTSDEHDRTLRPSATTPRMLDRKEVRAILGESCGVLRNATLLRAAMERLEPAVGQDDAYVAWLIAQSALAHPRSVGSHRRTDDITEEAS